MSRSRGDRSPPLLPPRKRDWKEGATQVGLFIRFPEGATIQMSSATATEALADIARSLLHVFHCKGCAECAPIVHAARAFTQAFEKRREEQREKAKQGKAP